MKLEKVFKGEREIKYVFLKSYKPSKDLVIMFSGIPAIGSKPSYNYRRTLEGYNCNKLFILDDFGARASYYLCENRDYAIERSVIALIDHISEENGITNILAGGSSKGGYAALYFGIKYGFNHIIAASPQYYLGDYLLKTTKSQSITDFMVGGHGKEEHNYLNNIMGEMIAKSPYKPNIIIHVGEGEYHYKSHVIPLMEALDKKGISYTLDLGKYNKHSEVAIFFPPLLRETVSKLFNYPYIRSLEEKEEGYNKYSFIIKTDSSEDQFAFYVNRDGERIETKKYSSENNITISLDEEGKYGVTAFAKNKSGNIVSIKSNPISY